MKRLLLPFRGEFGIKVRYHVPAAFAMRPEVVCIEPGEEALFPGTHEHVVVPKKPDASRRDQYSKDMPFLTTLQFQLRSSYPADEYSFVRTRQGGPELRFIPKPVAIKGLSPDVVICPRYRIYGRTKNWTQWPTLEKRLTGEGLKVFAGGAPDSSVRAVGCDAAWNYPRHLDATIESILAAKVVVATDSGLALLAVLCGRPLILIGSGGGLVAPGPVINSDGRVMRARYWPVRLAEYYWKSNHMKSPIWFMPDGWENVDSVVQEVLSRL